MSGMLFVVVCLAFQYRKVEKVDDQKAILLSAAIGTFVMCAVIISMALFRDVPLAIPPMIATGSLAVLSFWSRSKLSQPSNILDKNLLPMNGDTCNLA